jgi:hypothetical protein
MPFVKLTVEQCKELDLRNALHDTLHNNHVHEYAVSLLKQANTYFQFGTPGYR